MVRQKRNRGGVEYNFIASIATVGAPCRSGLERSERPSARNYPEFRLPGSACRRSIARSKRGEQLKPDEINRAVTDLSNLSAEKYSDVVVASFGGRKEQYVSLPTELKDSFKEWVDFFKAQNTHPQSVAMNENILKAITA